MGIVPIDTEGTTLYRKGEGRGKKEEWMRRGEKEGEEKGGRGERRELYAFLFPTSNHKAELMGRLGPLRATIIWFFKIRGRETHSSVWA